ncbi:ShlB/FhaC/HecB family hemolysin secretion/activation protein [Janthinobacterium sp.]|uniref:ShlB/FhaC/HecB family hemolysin secretion/activation protein n=1 Tax=Janthinobacterium sp. TaxID=1871054 RepID=UPI00293D5A8B|nr:ShlB/FhaC/HecB family hemolysin secretion/activation protein [Janthinobacterium sp.]
MEKFLLPLAFLTLSQAAYAVDPPGAGSQILQVPPAPQLPKAAPEIRIQRGATAPAALADDTTIVVNTLRVTAATQFPADQLAAVTGFTPGRELSLNDLRAMAAKVADYYHARGYFLAQAFLPAQDIQDGAVRIAVLEGQYGAVTLRNQSRVADGLARQVLAGLQDGDTIAAAPLERRLLLLSDLPGVEVKSTLVPGASLGASDLIVDVGPGPRVSGSVDADNQGNRYTGTKRVGATLNVNEVFGYGDVATVRGFTSADGLNYVRAAYQGQIGLGKLGLAYTNMDYRLGEEFAALKASGTAKIASVYASYPLLRTRAKSVYAQVNYDSKSFHDKTDSSGAVSDKDARVWMLNVNGDWRDELAGGGVSNFSLTWTTGKIDIRSPVALLNDAATVASNGRFNKFSLSAMRLQYLNESTSLLAALNAQVAGKNLDISEKMGLGGVGGVRAYPGGEGYADQGYVLSLELRRSLPTPAALPAGQLQALAFVDTGSVSLNKHPYAPGENRKTLSGAGLGLSWMGAKGLSLKLYYAHKLGSAEAVSVPDRMGRVWLQAIQYF